MSRPDLHFPDLSGHPPPPRLSYEQYAQWVCGEIVPDLARRGEMTAEKLVADFMNNEGRVTEWPDFGAARDLAP